jgi:endonuclease G
MNKQTFYFSNMTPQLDRLNQDMWAQLETKVRNNKCSDTLYVVTGAYFGSGAGTTTDGAGNTVPIPTHYYKVLLRTKSGNSGKAIQNCTADELISIGFWVEQKSYGNIAPPTSICTTVSDIEKKTGFTFFPKVADSVKQQNNPTQWGIK